MSAANLHLRAKVADAPPGLKLEVLTLAREGAARSGHAWIEELEAITGLPPRKLAQEVADAFAIPLIETADLLRMSPAFDLLPLSRAMLRHCVVVRDGGSGVIAVIADPFDVDLQSWLEARAGCPLQYRIALQADIQAYLARQEESAKALDSFQPPTLDARSGRHGIAPLTLASVSEATSPTVKLLSSILYDALKSGASDIHLETTPSGLVVKYRLDGMLDHATSAPGIEAAEQLISRLKVLSELDIAERRIPQDGSFSVASGGRDIDLRVSIMPSIHGEDAVIRILDKQTMIQAHGALRLEALGFDQDALSKLRRLVEEPYGMFLVTGPTGSGKTTTLYAALTEIYDGRDKIITIEDPVEYQLPGILQIPVNDKKGLSFAKGLRSILRHDPDKIMVGEIRDRETAEIAVQSALTGHLVLTTVHANNVFDVFGRFSHMGVDPYAFVSALNGIWAQRLVRLNCGHCAVACDADDEELARIQMRRQDLEGYQLRRGTGCGDCRGTGYRGRRSIAEVLLMTDEIRELVVEKRPIRQVKEAARCNGTQTLREAALELVRRGETTLSEVRRVTQNA